MAGRRVGAVTALSAVTVVLLLLGMLLMLRALTPSTISGSPLADAAALRTSSTATPPGRGTGRPGVTITVPPLTTTAPGPTSASPPPVPVTRETTASSPAPSEPSLPAGPEPTPTPEPAPAPATGPTAEPRPEPVPPAVPPTVPAQPPADPGLPVLVPPYDQVLGEYGSDRVAYLTFDDGPGPSTPAVLDILDAAGVKATFCQVGSQIDGHPDTERRIIAAGHTLCNHSWDHPQRMDLTGAAAISAEMTRTQEAMASYGATARWFRAPGGWFGTDDPTLRQVAQVNGLIPLGWEVDSQDWRKPGVPAIVDTVLSTVRPGAVILLHDAGGSDRDQTLAALPQIITGLRAAGYDLRPLPPGGL